MTAAKEGISYSCFSFQYRKRYEVTCDLDAIYEKLIEDLFQYRKRYEVTCDTGIWYISDIDNLVSIPQAV